MVGTDHQLVWKIAGISSLPLEMISMSRNRPRHGRTDALEVTGLLYPATGFQDMPIGLVDDVAAMPANILVELSFARIDRFLPANGACAAAS